MIRVDYTLLPEEIEIESRHRLAIAAKLHLPPEQPFQFKVIRRNIDARARRVYYVLRAEVGESISGSRMPEFAFRDVHHAETIHIIGTGPCGYFAALECLQLGYKPILFERGKDVQSRRRDLRAIQQQGIVNPHSNYCFGEGGAGTYSDGKLYTRSHKRGDIKKVLQLLVYHGAPAEILIDVHPHIGSNKLPGIVKKIRETILAHGGEIYFDTMIEDLEIANGKVTHLISGQRKFPVHTLIVAAGHSARELFHKLREKNISLQAKAFALGIRVEHPQSFVDQWMYHQVPRSPYLPAASYAVAHTVDGKGVFSFCMCPGGLIVPAATSPGEIVVNGMSLSRRDSPFANSGLVTAVDDADYGHWQSFGPLRAMAYQRQVEQAVFRLGDGSQKAPAQRLLDFVNDKLSKELPESSYIPGLVPCALKRALPGPVTDRLRKALSWLGKKYPGYLHKEAIVVATESRTSSPVRIPRHPQTGRHPEISNLYPAGEGAGYAGGILSAAMDGQRVVQNIKSFAHL